MTRKFLVPVATFVFLFSCFKNSEGLKKSDIPSLMNQFLMMHVQYHTFDDNLSERTLNNFINSLDYGKYYFYKKDIDGFMKYKYKIDDLIQSNSYLFIEEMYSVYKKRFDENIKLFNELINLKYDFTTDEKILVDRDKVDYADNRKDMRERWRKNIKLQLLNYMSADLSVDDAKKKLKKKYELLVKRVNEIDEDKLLARFMNSFTMALDPHSNYLTQEDHEDFSISMQLKLEGIGVRLKSEDGFVIVESVITGGATDKLPEAIKLKPGDKIVAVSQSDEESVDVIDMDLRDVVKMIRGKKGTEVRLTILRESGENSKTLRFIVPIVREEIKLQDSDAEYDIFLYNNDSKRKIGYIKLPSFYYDRETGKSSSSDVKEILKKLNDEKVKGIVLDLRGNPGGLLNEAIDIAGFFIESGPLLQIKDSRNRPQIIYDDDDQIYYRGPLIVLIDKFSASASEILAGAIKDYRRGLIIGPTNSFGKGTVQSYNELPFKKGAIKITLSIFYQPGGTSNQLNGIVPDIVIPDMSSIWDIGEDKSRYPLQWKRIESADFKPFNLVSKDIIGAMSRKSSARIKSDGEFKKLIERINKFKNQLNNKLISLKEESMIEKQKEKELEKSLGKEETAKIMDTKNDLLLREAFNITNDYINTVGR